VHYAHKKRKKRKEKEKKRKETNNSSTTDAHLKKSSALKDLVWSRGLPATLQIPTNYLLQNHLADNHK